MKMSVVSLALCFALCLSAASAAAPNKPVWPSQFDSPFGLYNLNLPSPIVNATAHFYYNFDVVAQVIDYPQQCIPLLPGGNLQPCKVYFNQNGTYLSQPALGSPCCLAFPEVGPVPPAFLAGFDFNSTQTASDYYGIEHQSNYWLGSGFAYWTDATTGDDVFFNDGGTGIFWSWGRFNVVPQPASLFQLPGTDAQCNTACPGFGASTSALARLRKARRTLADPMIRLAMHHHAKQFAAGN